MNNCQARALITSGRQVDVARQLAQEVASLQVTVLTSSAKPEPPWLLSFKVIQSDFPPQCLPKINIDLDLACLIYAFGSTGDPKGVMSDHSNVLYGLKGVPEAAVIGVPDPVLGEAIKAFVVRSDIGLTETDVLKHCSNHLEDFMVPKYIEFGQELPKTSSGKIKKTGLK